MTYSLCVGRAGGAASSSSSTALTDSTKRKMWWPRFKWILAASHVTQVDDSSPWQPHTERRCTRVNGAGSAETDVCECDKGQRLSSMAESLRSVLRAELLSSSRVSARECSVTVCSLRVIMCDRV